MSHRTATIVRISPDAESTSMGRSSMQSSSDVPSPSLIRHSPQTKSQAHTLILHLARRSKVSKWSDAHIDVTHFEEAASASRSLVSTVLPRLVNAQRSYAFLPQKPGTSLLHFNDRDQAW
jgi:hypothetical protein